MKDIWTILEKAGYDCDSVSDEQWEDFNSDWEQECEDYLDASIMEREKEIVLEWAYKTGVKKNGNINKKSQH